MDKKEAAHDEMTATVDEEVKETPEEQKGEAEVPEEFQREASELVGSVHNKLQLSYIRELIYRKETEINDAETKSKKKGKKVPQDYSLAEAPSM
jgi:hypothetical protein